MLRAKNIPKTRLTRGMNWNTTHASDQESCQRICNIIFRARSKPITRSFSGHDSRAPLPLVPVQFCPCTILGALLDGFAEQKLFLAGGGSWKFSRRLEIPPLKIAVIIVEQLHESVGVAFGVTAGVRSVWARGGTK